MENKVNNAVTKVISEIQKQNDFLNKLCDNTNYNSYIIIDDYKTYVAIKENEGINHCGIAFVGSTSIVIYKTLKEANKRIERNLSYLHNNERYLSFKPMQLKKYISMMIEKNNNLLNFINKQAIKQQTS